MQMSRLVLSLVGAAAVAVAGLVVVPKARAAGTEEPSYEVVARHEGFEVRSYAPRIVAQTTVITRAGEAGNVAFSILANYIFGNNRDRQKISMTAPVAIQPEIAMTAPVTEQAQGTFDGEGKRPYVVTFTMPAKWTMETLPEPRDPRVKLRAIEAQRIAVAKFSGRPGPADVERRKGALLEAVRAQGYAPTSAVVYAQYDPPWTPPFMRRNEVWVELAPAG